MLYSLRSIIFIFIYFSQNVSEFDYKYFHNKEISCPNLNCSMQNSSLCTIKKYIKLLFCK